MCFQHKVSGSCAASGCVWEKKCQSSALWGRHFGGFKDISPPLAVPEVVGAAGSGSYSSEPTAQGSKLVELQLGLGKDGLGKGSWTLLLEGLFLFFLLPICKKGPRYASAACLPGVWPCLFHHPRFSGELPCSAQQPALGTILVVDFWGVEQCTSSPGVNGHKAFCFPVLFTGKAMTCSRFGKVKF